MYIKFICVGLISFAILQDAHGKKSKKKRVNNDDGESTPQPNVLTYSTFGFNDIGSYDGFVPSSPDFANYLTKSQESSTRLYAPAFPSAIDTTGLGSYYDPQPETGPLNINSDVTGNENPYQGVSINFFTSPNHDLNGEDREITETNDFNTGDINSPIYGAKLSSKSKNKHLNNLNSTEFNIFDSVSSVINDNVANNNVNNYPRIPSAPSIGESNKIVSSNINPSNSVKFSKFVDFTDVKNYYPTSVESKYQGSIQKPIVIETIHNNVGENNYQSFHNSLGNERKVEQTYKNKLNNANDQLKYDKDMNNYKNDEIQNSNTKKQKIHLKPNTFNIKENIKTRPANNNSERKRIRNPMKGYEYATNYSTTSFKFDYDRPKRPFNNSIDEISPASSNLELIDYQLPETENSGFKNIHDIKSYDNDNIDLLSGNYRNKYKLSEDHLNPFKNLYTDVPSTTSQWGNIFKNSDFSSYKSHPIKSYFGDDSLDDTVYIPKKQKNQFGKYTDIKVNDFSLSNNYKPYKINDNKQEYDWPKDFFNTRFKSEEDLLGLRNQDTSYPYQSTFKPSYGDFAEEIDYKKLAQRWKNNYLKSKYRDAHREYQSYATETKPVHVPLPKPYAIEIPHPVIVPVPQPYPVKVPIPKPVAVPVIRELTVSVEKPMPYPVIRKVPYPVEKLVPVPVEKQVHVPVIKPYPVHIPQIRPVFHHTKTHDYDESDVDEDEYVSRPDTKRPVYKRPKTSYNRPRAPSRRPSRMTYHDRVKKRVPSRRPGQYDQRARRPYQSEHRPQRHRDVEEYDSENEFEIYCRKTGRC